MSFPPAAVAASRVVAIQADGGIEGVAVRALDTSRAEAGKNATSTADASLGLSA